jgi:hypothetical protein
MTAKEKARDLVDKFVYHVESNTDWGQLNNAKECALIAVDEILKQCWDYRDIDLQASYDYWQEVKTEINKIEL